MKKQKTSFSSRLQAAGEHAANQKAPNRWPEVILAAITATAIISLVSMPPLLGIAVWAVSAYASFGTYTFIADVAGVKKDMQTIRTRAEAIEREKTSPSREAVRSPTLSQNLTTEKTRQANWRAQQEQRSVETEAEAITSPTRR